MSNTRSEIDTSTPPIYVPNTTNTILRNLSPSVAAGLAISVTTFPLEGLKKHRQRYATETGLIAAKSPLKVFAEHSAYRILGRGNPSTVSPFRYLLSYPRVLKAEGFNPYRGLSVFAANVIPTTTTVFATDAALNSFLPTDRTFKEKLGASVVCGISGAFCATLVENMITRQQEMKSGPVHAMRDMLKVSPFRPWKSFPLIATREGIFTMVMLTALPAIHEYYKKNPNTPGEGFAKFLVCVSGALASHPFDTVATNLQKTHDKKSALSVAKEILVSTGTKGLYSGALARVTLFTAFTQGIPLIRDFAEKTIFGPKPTKN